MAYPAGLTKSRQDNKSTRERCLRKSKHAWVLSAQAKELTFFSYKLSVKLTRLGGEGGQRVTLLLNTGFLQNNQGLRVLLPTGYLHCNSTFRGSLVLNAFFCVLNLKCLNTVLAIHEYVSFAKSRQEKGCSSQAETWQVKNTLMKNFDWQVKFDVFVVSMATWTIEYNLKISLLLSLHKIRSLDFPINLHTAYYN